MPRSDASSVPPAGERRPHAPNAFCLLKGQETLDLSVGEGQGQAGGQRTQRPGGTFTVQETIPRPGKTRGRRDGREGGRNLLQGG